MAYDINRNLEHGEEILWEGKPNIKLFHFCDIFMLPFSTLIFGAIAYFIAEQLFYFRDLHWTSIGLMLAFILSLYGMFGRTIKNAITKSRTKYYVTNQRVIIAVNNKKTQLRSQSFDTIWQMKYKQRKFGRSRIVFDKSPFLTPLFANSGLEVLMSGESWFGTLPPAFYDINDAKYVYDIVIKLMENEKE